MYLLNDVSKLIFKVFLSFNRTSYSFIFSSLVLCICTSTESFIAPSAIASTLQTKGMEAPDWAESHAWDALVRFRREWETANGAKYTLWKTERLVSGEMRREATINKVRRTQKGVQLYLAALMPERGQEVIYPYEGDRRKLRVHKGSFPDITLSLDIKGGLATGGQHHLVSHGGYSYLIKRIFSELERERKTPTGGKIENLGGVVLWGRPAQKIVLISGPETFRTVKAYYNESVFAFAKRAGCDAYQLVYYNSSVSRLTSRLEEITYKVPLHYGSKLELILDNKTGLPLLISVWDLKGRLYERLEHRDLVKNPGFTDIDFDPNNPAYDF